LISLVVTMAHIFLCPASINCYAFERILYFLQKFGTCEDMIVVFLAAKVLLVWFFVWFHLSYLQLQRIDVFNDFSLYLFACPLLLERLLFLSNQRYPFRFQLFVLDPYWWTIPTAFLDSAHLVQFRWAFFIQESYSGFLELVEWSHQTTLFFLLFAITNLHLIGEFIKLDMVWLVLQVWRKRVEIAFRKIGHLKVILKVFSDLHKSGPILRWVFQHLPN